MKIEFTDDEFEELHAILCIEGAYDCGPRDEGWYSDKRQVLVNKISELWDEKHKDVLAKDEGPRKPIGDVAIEL